MKFAAMLSTLSLVSAEWGGPSTFKRTDIEFNPTQFNAEDIAAIKAFKFDHVMFKTKKDCALDNFPDVSTILLLTRFTADQTIPRS